MKDLFRTEKNPAINAFIQTHNVKSLSYFYEQMTALDFSTSEYALNASTKIVFFYNDLIIHNTEADGLTKIIRLYGYNNTLYYQSSIIFAQNVSNSLHSGYFYSANNARFNISNVAITKISMINGTFNEITSNITLIGIKLILP